MTGRPRLEGTPKPHRADGYLYPDRSRRMLWTSLGGAALIAVALVALHFTGVRRTLSPGPLASQHANFEVKCAQCHDAGNAVTAVRCERCHDPGNSERLTHAAHILIGTGDPLATERAQEQPCQSCHLEHRGRRAVLRAVDDRECGSCHLSDDGRPLRSFDRHPEFAIVKARATAGVGVEFGHQRHLQEVLKVRGAGEACGACHEATPDRRAFQPLTFERHCASCHLENGLLTAKVEAVPATWLTLPSELSAVELGSSRPDVAVDEYAEATITGLRHRDEWMLYNVSKLRTGVDPHGVDADRLTLQAQLGYLDALMRARSVQQVPAGNLATAIAAIERELADIDARLEAASGEDGPVLAQLSDAARAIAGQLQGLDPAVDLDLKTVVDASGPAGVTGAPAGVTDVTAFEQRKAELLALVDAVAARAPEGPLRERAGALRAELDELEAAPGSDSNPAPLLTRLDALDSLFRSLRDVSDAGVQAELARLDVQRRFAQQQIAGGLAPGDFEARRRELLGLLEAIDARGTEALRLRAGVLRQRVLAIRPGGSGDSELRRARRSRARQLERLRLELELRRSPRDQEPAPAADPLVDRTAVDARRGAIRGMLARLDAAPGMDPPADETELDDRRVTFKSLLTGACSKCHQADQVRARLVPVRTAEPVMPRSVFNHAPHVTRASCGACHGGPQSPPPAPGRPFAPSIWTSTLSSEVNVPGKALCATCHAPSKSSDACETCHVYHASSPARLVSLNP